MLPVSSLADNNNGFGRCSTTALNRLEVFLAENCSPSTTPAAILCDGDCFIASYRVANCQSLSGNRQECRDLVTSTKAFCEAEAPNSFGAEVPASVFDCNAAGMVGGPMSVIVATVTALLAVAGVQVTYF